MNDDDRILSPAIERRRLAALPAAYVQGERTRKERQELATFKLALHVADTHLTPEELRTPRHLLLFRRTLHVDACVKCARESRRLGGRWENGPETAEAGR